jgi:tRNA (mo5U34)-methyltransferase
MISENRMEDLKWWHRIKLPDGRITPGACNHGPDDDQSWMTNRFGLPIDLTGKRVIDIGAADGGFSFEAERRGAKYVMAVEGFEDTGNNCSLEAFRYAHNSFGSNVNLVTTDFMRIANVDQFDIVLFYGVLYHVLEPLSAIQKLFDLCSPGGEVIIETASKNTRNSLPVIQFSNGHDGDPTNYWYPNVMAIYEMAKFVGFHQSEWIWAEENDVRITVKLYKKALE